jgi:hypothetical protein
MRARSMRRAPTRLSRGREGVAKEKQRHGNEKEGASWTLSSELVDNLRV